MPYFASKNKAHLKVDEPRDRRKELHLQRELNDTSQMTRHGKDGLVICARNTAVRDTTSAVSVPKEVADAVNNRAIGQPILHLEARHKTKHLQ